MAKTELGVIHGRFQVLHNDHMTYLLAAKERCDHLVVGITNPDPQLTRHDAADSDRSDSTANPLTYYERFILVRDALLEAGLNHSEFCVVPFPVNLPELYRYYVPMDAVFYLTIYDEWGRRKLELFRSEGLKTEVMWERPRSEKGLTGARIRNAMVMGEPWEAYVPRSVASHLKAWKIADRLRQAEAGPV